ncbi:hypothetical protein DMP69_00005 [Klebsiella pneumoniae]|nr:hypothetical protein DMP69_00005 [Klebsiella pneumoniae]
MDSVHHIWCPLSSQEYQDLPDGAETTLTLFMGHPTVAPLTIRITAIKKAARRQPVDENDN